MSVRPVEDSPHPQSPTAHAAEEADGNITVTDDAFLGGALQILQPASGYRAGLDAVLLAASVPNAWTVPHCRILDAGAGVGTVGLCIARRLNTCEVVLVERHAGLAELADRNIARNNLADRVRTAQLDIRMTEAEHRAAGLASSSFDVVVANPPYMNVGAGRASTDPIKRDANAMPPGDLEQWARFLARIAKPNGRLAMIHRADALDRLLSVLDGRFGALELLPVHPRNGEPANRVLVHGRKGSRAPLVIHAGLVLHADDGRFTPALEAILRDGGALAWPPASSESD